MHYDFAIIGSGFGGSVSALRLAEKGYRVAVIEQGKWVDPARMEAAAHDSKKLFWMPGIGLDGFFSQSVFRHLGMVGGVGVGGGSLVYAAVLLRPKDKFYEDPLWSSLGIDWKREMAPYYEKASQMLGITPNPGYGTMDEYLRKTAQEMGAGATFGPTPMGIYFGTPGVMAEDPFFNGHGPVRTGCHLCGECLTGCPHGAKNSLDKNYLYLAQRSGAVILPERKVVKIEPMESGNYRISMKHPLGSFKTHPPLTAARVVIAAGVLGSLELLHRCRDVTQTLPHISRQMGRIVRTNSEAIVGALSPDPDLDLSGGTTISSDFYPDPHTHITQNRFPRGFTFNKWYFAPMTDHGRPLVRSLLALGKILVNPRPMLENWFAKNWHRRVTILTVMQNLDNQVSLGYGRSFPFLFLKRRLKTVPVKGREAPTNLPVANRAASILARLTKGVPLNIIMESMMNLSFTAHILGGCHMGASPDNGVIDTSHQVFGCPGIYVVDGAAISANVGVNPSLTIAAMAERAMGLIPLKKEMPNGYLTNPITVKKEAPVKKTVKRLLMVTLLFLLLNLALTGINIFQKGGPYDGRPMEEILGRPPSQAVLRDIEQLEKPEVMQLFFAARVPELSNMKGEYKAVTLGVGVLAPAVDFYTHHLFGPGHWEGKAFCPTGENRGRGYNLFSVKDENKDPVKARARRIVTFVGPSNIDGKTSFHLEYRTHNRGLVKTMQDEIRRINDRLFIGMGHMAVGGGAMNPAPFVLYGKPAPWVGADADG